MRRLLTRHTYCTTLRKKSGRRLRPNSRFFTPKPFEDIPGPQENDERGTMDDLGRRTEESDFLRGVNSCYRDYGPLVKQKIRGKYEVYVFHPDDILEVYKNDDAIPKSPLTEFGPLRMYYQSRNMKAPFSSDKEDWKATRTVLQKDIFPQPTAATYTKILNEPCAAASSVIDRVRIEEFLPFAAFDMFSSVVFGKEIPYTTPKFATPNREKENIELFVEEGMLVGELCLAAHFAFSESQEYAANESIQTYFNAMDSATARGLKFVREAGSHVLSSKAYDSGFQPYFKRVMTGGKSTFDDLVDNVITFYLAGIDSTSSVTSWILLNLARFPEVQEKLYQEVMSVVGNGDVTEDHLKNLVYMSQVIRETHRFTSPGPITTARTLERPIVLSGYLVPAGVRIQLATSAFQWDPKIVDRPDEFLPERWSKEAQEARRGTPKEALDSLGIAKPFGLGSRMCLAARLVDVMLRVFLSHVVRNWKFSYDPSKQSYQVLMKTVTVGRPYPKMEFSKRT